MLRWCLPNHLTKGAKIIVNAASQEYWKSVEGKLGNVPVLTVEFPGQGHADRRPMDFNGF